MAKFASYPDEFHGRFNLSWDSSFYQGYLDESRNVRCLVRDPSSIMHVFQSVYVYVLRELDQFSCNSVRVSYSLVTIHDVTLHHVHATMSID